jgi:hypothetical protein
MTKHTDASAWSSFFTDVPGTWLETSKTLSGASQAIATRWLKDCSDQVQSNLDTMTKLAECRDTGEATAIQQRWWQSAVDRFSAELRDCQDQLTAVSPFQATPARPTHTPKS